MKNLVVLFAATALLGLAASTYAQPEKGQNVGSSDYGSGEAVYRNTCQFCHGVTGDGKGPAAPALNPRPQDFTDPTFWKYADDELIARTIRSGHGRGMPAFRFSPQDIKAVIEYISHFNESRGK